MVIDSKYEIGRTKPRRLIDLLFRSFHESTGAFTGSLVMIIADWFEADFAEVVSKSKTKSKS